MKTIPKSFILLVLVCLLESSAAVVIPLDQADTPVVPAIDGSGVAIELYNGIGGGPAPTPSALTGVTPSGTTLSPYVDFPNPGAVINVGTSFDTFFAGTTLPPEEVSGLAATNFLLRIRSLIKITRDLDLNPSTPEIDVYLDVGSDDGFHLTVGSTFLGSAGDRGFSWSSHYTSFEDEGLYPVTLLFAANAVGQSGLEFAWQHAGSGGRVIIPQASFYPAGGVGDRLITFEEKPVGTVLGDDFTTLGVRFSNLSGQVQVTDVRPTEFLPVSGNRVLADPRPEPGEAGRVRLDFVAPDGTSPASTSLVTFYLIDAEAPGARVQAFDSAGNEVFDQTYAEGGRTQTEVRIARDYISRVEVNLGGAGGSDTAAIDQLSFRVPEQVTVTATAFPAAGNTVTGGGTVPKGAQVTLEAAPVDRFVEWQEGGVQVSTSNVLTLTAAKNTNLVAVFVQPASVVFSNLNRNFNGGPQAAEFETQPPRLSVTVTYNGGAQVPIGPGTYAVKGVVNDRFYQGEATAVMTIRRTQTIAFDPPAELPGSQLGLSATATSGLPVLFQASPSQVATVNGSVLTAHRGGEVTITAAQNGNEEYWPAEPVVISRRLPPIISSFTANGVELTDGTVLSADGEMRVAALDAVGISRAEFSGQVPGAGGWTPLGTDETPGDGFQVPLSLAALPGGAYSLRVIVSTPDGSSASVTRNVVVSPAPVLGLVLDGPSVMEGDSLGGTVSLSQAQGTDFLVTLSSPHPTQLNAGPAVLIPAGGTSARFTIMGRQDTQIEAPLETRIVAGATGVASMEIPVTVTDDDWPILTLALDRASVSESVGENAAVATLRRGTSATQPLTVNLLNSLPAALTAPATVTIPGGATSVSFPLGVVNDTVATGARTAQLRAEVRLDSGEVVSEATVSLGIDDDEGPRLELAAGKGWVLEGGSESVTVRRRDTPLDAPLTVTLAASPAGQLTVPATAQIPAGAAETVVTVSGVNDGPDGSTSVEINASATGLSAARLPLVVTDQTLPDLVVSNASAPSTVETEAYFTVGYRLDNKGAAAAAGPFAQRILLSTDPVPGDDVVLSQSDFTAPLPAGTGFERSETVRALRAAGTYWLLVVTDARSQVDEILETNNTVLAARPITIGAAYQAAVRTDAGVVPANTPIPLTGSASRTGGVKVPNALVNIHILTAGTERIISAITNSAGDFSTVWKPLPGEGGEYEIGASHPGLEAAPVQDTFTILTVKTEFPAGPLALDAGGGAVVAGTLTNPTGHGLTGLSFMALDAPAGLQVQGIPGSGSLAPGQTAAAEVTLTAAAGLQGSYTVQLQLNTDQGVKITIPLNVTVRPLVPLLVVAPEPLKASALRGEQKSFGFTVENQGAAATGPVEVLLPPVPWITLASASPLPSIAPGGSASITLLLSPGATQDLTSYSGYLALIPATGAERDVPFEFRVVSSRTGDLRMDVVDEAFYFTAEAPHVQGASVIVRDAVSSDEVTRAETPVSGIVNFPNLTEGWYGVEVSSPDHAGWKGNVFVDAGGTTSRQIFISRDWVKYTWTVQEVEYEDHYRISVESTFETNVPAPVVTVTPAVLDVEDLKVLGQTKVINYTIENHGLIAANHGKITVSDHPFYEVTPLIDDLGTISAKSSITIPVTVRRVGEFAEDGSIRLLEGARAAGRGAAQLRAATLQGVNAAADGGGVPCGMAMQLYWDYICGIPVPRFAIIPGSGVVGSCPVGGYGWIPTGGPIGGGPTWSGPAVFMQSYQLGCDPDCLRLAILSCVPGPVGAAADTVACGKGLIQGGVEPMDIVDCGVSLAGHLYPPAAGFACVYSILRCFSVTPAPAGRLAKSLAALVGDEGGENDVKDIYKNGIRSEMEAAAELLGSGSAVWLNPLAGPATGEWIARFQSAARPSSEGGRAVTANERAQLLAGTQPPGVPDTEVVRVLDRWNRTLDNIAAGILSPQDAPAGSNLDFINLPALRAKLIQTADYQETAEAAGYPDSLNALVETVRHEEIGQGVCARVKLRVDQDAVMTRTAFRGTLELTNNRADVMLTEVGFDLDVRDAAGVDARDLFNIRVTGLKGLAAIDGTGQIAEQASGSAEWTLIPRDTAAPAGDTAYTIGGTIRYKQGGTLFSIPVDPALITVKPDAALYLKYFHQRDVFSDDPRTGVVEPAVPYNLAVMVENRGAGAARNLTITSAQPEIVENEKGLLIDFQIIGTEVAGQNLTPSLTAPFGNVDPGQRKIATWLLTSSLQGLFIDYNATFEHLDGLGDERISLIKEVEIHEMIHRIEALGTLSDGLPDFLVNDVADVHDYPDTVHLSDGATAPVTVVTAATVSGPPAGPDRSVTVTPGPSSGWTYLRIPDPTDGLLRLTRVVRSDGLEIPLDKNVWTTDRTFLGLGRQPARENILHLADYNTPGSYTLTYAPAPATDTDPPVSTVAPLPEHSGVVIPVRWSGTDASGIASWDIFVRINGGEWQPWLAETTRTSGLYDGVMGRTYEFRSRARDRAGNAEGGPESAQAGTLVSLTNSVPAVDPVPDQTISEGSVFEYRVTASDPDGPAGDLRFAVASGPAGLTVDPLTGVVRWVTGLTDGGKAVQAVITVTDAGIPPASAPAVLKITVNDSNRAPSVAPLEPRTLDAGETLLVQVAALDADVPVQTLTYSLAAGAPAGMTIDPALGEIIWTPGAGAQGKTFSATVVVTDSGTPPASASTVIALSVRAGLPPELGSVSADPVTVSGAVLRGTVNPGFLETGAYFEIAPMDGVYPPGGMLPVAEVPLSGGSSLGVSATAPGLLPHTAYRFRLSAGNSAGQVTGPEGTFTTANSPPVFSGYAFTTPEGRLAEIVFAKLTAAGSDADGDPLAVVSASSPGAHGGIIMTGVYSLTYTPPAGYTGPDSFTVTLMDGFGGSVTGPVNVTVTPSGSPTLNEGGITFEPDGSVSLLYRGIPGRSYTLERSTDLAIWTSLQTLQADRTGALPFKDTSPPPGGTVFYRTRE